MIRMLCGLLAESIRKVKESCDVMVQAVGLELGERLPERKGSLDVAVEGIGRRHIGNKVQGLGDDGKV